MVLTRPEDPKSSNCDVPENHHEIKVPKRVLHFSDGVLEEYSDEENDTTDASTTNELQVANPAEMTWGPWIWYKTWKAGSVTLSALDAVGEALASFFGITTPKYYFEIEESKRREEIKKKEMDEARGWSQPSGDIATIHLAEMVTTHPKPEEV